ncbi:MAG: type II toxin-antitoxin system prevent-host-death family antitoxin [Boseongicola sp. SB0675_bin_26]|nr:type II toxin-antitoxin system prevent-host-death family antitoxin [Boseongicola sp. SB0675_bin_26]
MPYQYSLRDAKARLSELLDLAAAGNVVEITRQGAIRGRFNVVTVDGAFGQRRPGALKGRIAVPDTFDDEDPDIIADFEDLRSRADSR